MQYKLHTIIASAAICLSSISYGQTVATFDDLELPGENTDYASTLAESGSYSFTSSNVTFYGVLESWGGYGAFNYTNITDTLTEGFTNDKAAITGSGYDGSANYGVAYASADWPDHPTESLQIGAKLIGDAAGNTASGVYVTNTTYAYYYMKESYTSGDSYKLIIRGFLDGVQSEDSVTFTLAEFGTDDTILVKTWEWVDLTTLGNIDSLTFQVVATDDYTPFYFAIDNFTTLPAPCPVPQNITVTDITATTASITWDESLSGFTTNYEIAIDESATLAPSGTPELLTVNNFDAEGLTPGTIYYAHIRSVCDDGNYSEWDTASFITLDETGLSNYQLLTVTVSPNPASNTLHINTANTVDAIVYGLDGKQFINVKNTRELDISILPAGLYFLKVNDTNHQGTGITRFTKIN